MALPQTYGTAHTWALYDTVNFVTLQSDDISKKTAIDVTVTDETGKVITNRMDDLLIETSLSGVLLESATIPTVAAQLTYDGIQYIIKDVSDNGTNNGFRKVTLKLVKYQEIA
jgi:hypothetical protein